MPFLIHAQIEGNDTPTRAHTSRLPIRRTAGGACSAAATCAAGLDWDFIRGILCWDGRREHTLRRGKGGVARRIKKALERTIKTAQNFGELSAANVVRDVYSR